MSSDGVIVEVMETWPLQLVLDSGQGRFQTLLPDDAVIQRDDGDVRGTALLRIGCRVRIDGRNVFVSEP